MVGKSFLREALLLPIFPQIHADPAPHIHVGKGRLPQPIDLQTMSLICLDFHR